MACASREGGIEDVSGLTVTGISFAHPSTNTRERARLAVEGERLRAAYERLGRAGFDAFVLSTCLRVELVVLGCDEVLARAAEVVFPDVELPRTGIVRRGQDLLHHLFRVASGLNSPILGEPEVLGQFRSAVDTVKQTGTVGGAFGKLLESAITVGRSTRKMLPVTPAGSMALVAAAMAGGHEHVAVFGAGVMAKAAVSALRAAGPDTLITVYARHPETVDLAGVNVAHMSGAPKALVDFPVVISATAAKCELFGPEVLDEALSRRSSSLLLLDLAMPPDFIPGSAHELLTYRNIDQMGEVVRSNGVSAEVEAAVAQEAETRWSRLSLHSSVGPVVSEILDQARRAVDEEVRRFMTRLDDPNGNEEVLRQLAQTVAHRVLHPALSYLSSAESSPESVATIAEAFGVEHA